MAKFLHHDCISVIDSRFTSRPHILSEPPAELERRPVPQHRVPLDTLSLVPSVCLSLPIRVAPVLACVHSRCPGIWTPASGGPQELRLTSSDLCVVSWHSISLFLAVCHNIFHFIYGLACCAPPWCCWRQRQAM